MGEITRWLRSDKEEHHGHDYPRCTVSFQYKNLFERLVLVKEKVNWLEAPIRRQPDGEKYPLQ
jgi:hypothetical protein